MVSFGEIETTGAKDLYQGLGSPMWLKRVIIQRYASFIFGIDYLRIVNPR